MEFLKTVQTAKNICRRYRTDCRLCPMKIFCRGNLMIGPLAIQPEAIEQICIDYNAKHHLMTNAEAMGKLFPNADFENFASEICPKCFGGEITGKSCDKTDCLRCSKEWLLEEYTGHAFERNEGEKETSCSL